MNMNFKLGKVVIPVDSEMGMDIVIEGLEVSVSDYNLMEGLKVVQAVPKVLREMKAVFDGEDAPSADSDEVKADEKHEGETEDDFIEQLVKSAGGHILDHPLFGKHVAIPKGHPLASAFGSVAEPKSPFKDLLDALKKAEEKKSQGLGSFFDKLS